VLRAGRSSLAGPLHDGIDRWRGGSQWLAGVAVEEGVQRLGEELGPRVLLANAEAEPEGHRGGLSMSGPPNG
jgi:hypothetical protein